LAVTAPRKKKKGEKEGGALSKPSKPKRKGKRSLEKKGGKGKRAISRIRREGEKEGEKGECPAEKEDQRRRKEQEAHAY